MGGETTAYGKALRIIRVKNDELLKDMADRLQMTSAYLSAIENGKRNIPEDLTNKITVLYNLSKDDENDLKNAEEVSLKSINIELINANDEQKELAVAFAKKFNKLDGVTIKKLKNCLK